MHKTACRLSIFFLLLATAACGTFATVRPLPAGSVRVGGSVGGPLFLLGDIPLPAPIVTLSAAYAVTDDVWVDAFVDADSLAFGFGHVAVGYGQRWRAPDRWGSGAPDLNLDTRIHYFTDLSDHRVYPEISLLMAHGEGTWLPYWGADLFVDPVQLIRGEGLRFSMVGGLDWRVGNRFSLQLEGRWMAINYDASGLAVDYIALGSTGGVGLLIGMSWDVGGQ